MKTNNVMLRPMGQFNVEQRTKDGMFNATALLKQWNESNGTKKDINVFIEEENKFSLFFFGEYKPHMECSNGVLWLCESTFHNFMDFLSPELEIELYDCSLFANRFPFVVKGKPSKALCTYIMTDETGLYKIGKSGNPRKRLSSLSCGNANIRILFTLDFDIESELHKKFENKMVYGEWFKLSEEDLEYIKNYKTQQSETNG